MQARVLFKNAQNILIQACHNQERLLAKIATKNLQNIVVGDLVAFKKHHNEALVYNIYPRINQIFKPKVANIDNLIIVHSLKNPDFSPYMLYKFLLFYEARQIAKIIIYFSKCDLLSQTEYQNFQSYITVFQKENYLTFMSDQIINNKQKLLQKLKHQTSLFVGLSGSGKSSLINFLIPNLNLKTQAVSIALKRGKNTTNANMMVFYKNAYFIDTPGFSSLALNLTKNEIATGFNDFRLHAINCQFHNCLHDLEPNCMIKKLVKEQKISLLKYNNYIKILHQTN